MQRVIASVLLLFAVSACRTGAPTGAPIAPLTATSAAEAMQQLQARRAAFRGAKSLMRVRATTGGKTQSFRAQLVVHDEQRMELIAYTPVGTTAAVIHAEGDRVSVDNRMEGTKTEGDVSQVFGFLGTVLPPAEMSMLILGLPPREGLAYDVDAAGLRQATLGEMTATFDPPSYPASKVVVTWRNDRVEIEHLEVVAE
jgi:hypothetical protein